MIDPRKLRDVPSCSLLASGRAPGFWLLPLPFLQGLPEFIPEALSFLRNPLRGLQVLANPAYSYAPSSEL